MKKLVAMIVAGAAIAYGAYRMFGVEADLRAKDYEANKKTLDVAKEQAKKVEQDLQKRADDMVKSVPVER